MSKVLLLYMSSLFSLRFFPWLVHWVKRWFWVSTALTSSITPNCTELKSFISFLCLLDYKGVRCPLHSSGSRCLERGSRQQTLAVRGKEHCNVSILFTLQLKLFWLLSVSLLLSFFYWPFLFVLHPSTYNSQGKENERTRFSKTA